MFEYKGVISKECRDCKTKEKQHKAFGLCTTCYHKWYRRKRREELSTTLEVDKKE